MVARRHLRAWAMVVLALQSAWLLALVPRDCCAAHQPHASAPACHDAASDVPAHCPMPDASGAPCPMHASATQSEVPHGGSAHASGHAAPAAPSACTMRGACDGPMEAMMSLLSVHGILPAPVTQLPAPGGRLFDATSSEQRISRVVPPDAPPPRA